MTKKPTSTANRYMHEHESAHNVAFKKGPLRRLNLRLYVISKLSVVVVIEERVKTVSLGCRVKYNSLI